MTPINRKLGGRIRELRKARRITQEQLAEEAELTVQTASSHPEFGFSA